VRWLLRVLVEPAFLRYYVLEPERLLTLQTFEAEFFALPPDQERPAESRRDAWQRLRDWFPLDAGNGTAPARWFQCILCGLCDAVDLRSHLSELASFWALRELFDEIGPAGQAPSLPEQPPVGTSSDPPRYHELHCHFRGGVPFLVLWRLHLIDARMRAMLRTSTLLERADCTSWAELLERVAQTEPYAAPLEDVQDEQAVREHLLSRVHRIRDPECAPDDLRVHVQYVAACAGLASFLLHQRQHGGLAPFVASYDRYSKVQRRLGISDERHTQHLVHKLLLRFEREGVAAMELRPTLERTRADLQRKLRGLARGYLEYVRGPHACVSQAHHSHAPIAMGLVPSLFKQELGGRKEPESSDFWHVQQACWVDQVETLLEVLRDDPVLRWLVVGLDAAGQERGCQPSALRPAFALVRRYNQGNQHARPGRVMNPQLLHEILCPRRDDDPLEVLAAHCQRWTAQRIRLGITVHAGEDFEDPLTGLRHIWETVELLELEEGDRIGHGLAAGLTKELLDEMLARRYGSPPGTQSESYRLDKPRGTHLLDLAWIAQVAPAPCSHEARAQLGEVATRALGAPVNVEWVLQELRAHGSIPRLAVPSARFLSAGNLRAGDFEHVVLDQRWRERFETLRQQVLHLLMRKRIVVESCPTSNLLVANLRTPPLEKLLEVPGLRVVVATDDPGLLNSYPREELQRVKNETHRARVLREAAAASFVRLPALRIRSLVAARR
jgi:hypothetical protein